MPLHLTTKKTVLSYGDRGLSCCIDLDSRMRNCGVSIFLKRTSASWIAILKQTERTWKNVYQWNETDSSFGKTKAKMAYFYQLPQHLIKGSIILYACHYKMYITSTVQSLASLAFCLMTPYRHCRWLIIVWNFRPYFGQSKPPIFNTKIQ